MWFIVCLLCLAIGVVLGRMSYHWTKRGVEAPTPKPVSIGPSLDEQAHRAAVLATRAVEHAEWDAEWRKLCPPQPGIVWQRSITGELKQWANPPSPKNTAITDFNN